MKRSFFLLASLLVISQALGQQIPTEPPPTVPASQLLPAAILTGTDYGIGPQVQTDGLAGIFELYTQFGDYECAGREMLYLRLQELRAIEQIDRVSKTGAFEKAITQGAIGEPVEAVVKIGKNPVGSFEEAPLGAAHLVGEIVGGFGSFGMAVGKAAGIGKSDQPKGSPKPPPGRDDPIGYNVARNQWAQQFHVDPYTTNRPLALRLNHLGMISFSMDKVSGAVSGFAVGGFGPVAEYLSYLPDVDEHLLTKPPKDIDKYNTQRLAGLGASKRDIAPLMNNGWFSPTLQTRFVNDLVKLKSAANIPAAITLAANVESEEQARFVCESLELLARSDATLPQPWQMQTFGGMAAMTGSDGTLIVAAPADLISWTAVIASLAARPHPGVGHAMIYTNGLLTDGAKAGFASLGWGIGIPAL
jgi:hypothetical protein